MKPFVRVRSRITGHQFDVHVQAFNPLKHERVRRYPAASKPRRPKPSVFKRTSPAAGVEATGLSMSAGTDKKEVGA